MTKDPKTLPQAIKIIVGIYGKEVVKDVQMVNILNDVVSLEDPNAVKSILRDVVKMGYGKKILAINSQKEDFHIKVIAYAKQISDSYGYKEVIVQYVLYSIVYGLGWTSQMPYIKKSKTEASKERVKKQKAIAKQRDTENQGLTRKIPRWGVAVIGVIFVLVFGYISMYMYASSDREQFNERIFTGDSFMRNGDYGSAIESYKEAYNGYNALNSSSYKKDAFESMETLNRKLLDEGNTNNKSLHMALIAIQSELQLNLSKTEKLRLEEELEEVKTHISKKVESGHLQLITNISANNGKLDEDGKILLEQLMQLAPDDYWLNFIKKKSYD